MMVKMVAPAYSSLAPDLIKSYSPPDAKIKIWHTVKNGHSESLLGIAKQFEVPVQRLIEFNFPGSVKNDTALPDVVNWYLCLSMAAAAVNLSGRRRGQRIKIISSTFYDSIAAEPQTAHPANIR